MTNQSVRNFSFTQLEEDWFDKEVFKTYWLVGIAVSTICLSIQVFILYVIPNARKYDEKVLLQMTIARLVNSVLEYLIMNNIRVQIHNNMVINGIFAVYFYSDVALLCWMFVFTKNLYDKVVLVFVYEKLNLLVLSLLVWTLCLPVGVLVPVLMTMDLNYFFTFYNVYAHFKFFILFLNALIFIEIFHVAVRIGLDKTKNIRHFVKTAIIAFVLVCVTSLQVLVTDLLSYLIQDNEFLACTFCVLNSYQSLFVTIIFIILARKKTTESMLFLISMKLKKLVS